MQFGNSFLVVSYKDFLLLLAGLISITIGLGILSELQKSVVLGIAMGSLAVLGGVFVAVWESRFSVAVVRRDHVLIGPVFRNLRVPRGEIRAVVVVPGGSGPVAACALTLAPVANANWSSKRRMYSDALTWAGGMRRARRLAGFLDVPVEQV